MTSHSFGDVVLVGFPFTNLQAAKKRPAVVIHSSAYQDRPDVILMAITSQIRESLAVGEALLQDWQAAGLAKPSVIKPLIATLGSNRSSRNWGGCQTLTASGWPACSALFCTRGDHLASGDWRNALCFAPYALRAEKIVWLDAGLLEDGAQRTLGGVAGMVDQRGVAIGRGVEPDFVRAGGLAIEGESECLQPPCDFAIAESSESAHAGQPSTSG